MNNVMLDPLPKTWNGYPIESDYRIGIQIAQCLSDSSLTKRERLHTAADLLFPGNKPPLDEVAEAIQWFLNGYSYDKHKKKTDNVKVMDFDVDQWRIYSAFMNQYQIDLSKVNLHWWAFMGMLTNLDECGFTRVMDIRCKKMTNKMSTEERKSIKEAKAVFALDVEDELSNEDKIREEEAVQHFQELIGKR